MGRVKNGSAFQLPLLKLSNSNQKFNRIFSAKLGAFSWDCKSDDVARPQQNFFSKVSSQGPRFAIGNYNFWPRLGTTNFPIHIHVFTDESEIVVPSCKIKSIWFPGNLWTNSLSIRAGMQKKWTIFWRRAPIRPWIREGPPTERFSLYKRIDSPTRKIAQRESGSIPLITVEIDGPRIVTDVTE